MFSQLLSEGMPLGPFRPRLDFLPGLKTLCYLAEDASTTSVPVVRRRYHEWDILRANHASGLRVVGFQFWLWYDPNRLLADLR